MQRKMKIALAAGAIVVGTAGAGTVAVGAASTESNETPITGAALEQASAAALAQTGGGRVTETEQGDDDSFYEVDVTLDDGSEVEVQLDENFRVVGTETDDADDADDADDTNDPDDDDD